MQVPQILIVDDDAEDRMIMLEAMEMIGKGHFLSFAENGEQALAVLAEQHAKGELPCLVVLDLNMPKMNGTQTLRCLRNSELYNEIQVVIYSTSINPVEKEQCLKLGAQDFVTKPVSFDDCKVTAQKLLAFCSTDSTG